LNADNVALQAYTQAQLASGKAVGTIDTGSGTSAYKGSSAVDLKNPQERGKLADFIVSEADIVLQNMRAGLLASLDLDAASLRARNPRLIYCNLSAFGAKGPLAGRPGYDPLMQAFGGIMSVTGNEGEPPVRVGVSIVDQGAGMWAVIGILAALQRRNATGEGCEVDTSLYETALSWIGAASAGYQATGRTPPRRGSENPSLVPYKVFNASDGDLVIAAGNDNLFRKLAHALGRHDWMEDERFATNPARVVNRVVVNEAVQAAAMEPIRPAR
jgi:crotonobetainyl-CoA:carnitine CoA-transferase CaiB-like acyl-CoA transferase